MLRWFLNRDLRRVVDSIVSAPLLNSAVTQALHLLEESFFPSQSIYDPIKNPKVSRARQQTEGQVCVCVLCLEKAPPAPKLQFLSLTSLSRVWKG